MTKNVFFWKKNLHDIVFLNKEKLFLRVFSSFKATFRIKCKQQRSEKTSDGHNKFRTVVS
jgi:hypothetical protein